jgi:hypothetical protein
MGAGKFCTKPEGKNVQKMLHAVSRLIFILCCLTDTFLVLLLLSNYHDSRGGGEGG